MKDNAKHNNEMKAIAALKKEVSKIEQHYHVKLVVVGWSKPSPVTFPLLEVVVARSKCAKHKECP